MDQQSALIPHGKKRKDKPCEAVQVDGMLSGHLATRWLIGLVWPAGSVSVS
jgi:hypothetical protein